MTNNEILIYNRDDLRPGDVLRVWPQGSPKRWVEGPIWLGGVGDWLVGDRFIRWSDGEWVSNRFDLAAHPARRMVPPVDPAQVEALAQMIANVVSPGAVVGSGEQRTVTAAYIARRLLKTGRVEVKP